MLILIDIGNTNIKTGFYENSSYKEVLNIGTGSLQDPGKYTSLINRVIKSLHLKYPSGCVLCSVVPEVTPLVSEAIRKSFDIKPLHVTHKTKTGIKFPAALGADRIANAVAVRRLYKGNIIVITFGTATTFSVITSKGEYRGGAIMPGIGLSFNALAEKTAKLPKIKLKKSFTLLGESTEDNILSGVILGHAGAVERIVHEISVKFRRSRPVVVATGGYTDMIERYTTVIDHINPLLTLEGLRFIYELDAKIKT